jgi:NitT/TauT family transport system substrate-binding protein
MLGRSHFIVGNIVFALVIAGSAAAEPLKVTFSPWVGLGPLFVAKEKGFFDEEGLEVELIVMEDHKAKFAALAAGEIDVNAMSIDEMLNYLSEEQGYRYLFAVDDSRGGDGIVADKDIQTVADLEGKTVAYEKGIVSELYLGVLLKEAGLSLGDIKAVNMPFNDAGAAFIEGRVNAAVTGEPWLTKAKQSEHGHLLVDSSSSPGLIVDTLGTTPEKLAARTGDLKALYRAWVKAVEVQKANEKEADLIMARGFGGWLEDPAVLAEARAGIAFYDDAMNEAYIGTPEAPGGIVDTIASALELGRETGLHDHDVEPAALVAFEIVNQ